MPKLPVECGEENREDVDGNLGAGRAFACVVFVRPAVICTCIRCQALTGCEEEYPCVSAVRFKLMLNLVANRIALQMQ